MSLAIRDGHRDELAIERHLGKIGEADNAEQDTAVQGREPSNLHTDSKGEGANKFPRLYRRSPDIANAGRMGGAGPVRTGIDRNG